MSFLAGLWMEMGFHSTGCSLPWAELSWKEQNPAQVCSWGIGWLFKVWMLCSITTGSCACSEERLQEGNPEQAEQRLEASLSIFHYTALQHHFWKQQ